MQSKLNTDMKKRQNRRSCPYTGKCEPEKSRILTYFAQCVTTSHCKKKKKERKKDRLSVYTINCKFLCWVRFYKNYYHKIPEKLLILYCNNIWNKVILMVFTFFGNDKHYGISDSSCKRCHSFEYFSCCCRVDTSVIILCLYDSW